MVPEEEELGVEDWKEKDATTSLSEVFLFEEGWKLQMTYRRPKPAVTVDT